MANSNQYVLFSDGEGLTHGDLNDMQTYFRALVLDSAFGAMVGHSPPTMDGYSSKFCWTKGLAGYPRSDTGVDMTITNKGGLICQWSDGTNVPADSVPKLLCYWLLDDEISEELDAPDATNPRYDCIDIKLDLVDADSQSRDFEDASTGLITSAATSKKKRVQLTVAYTKGTAAATPTIPAVPAGYCRWGGAYVPAAGAPYVLTNVEHMLDFCLPIGGFSQVIATPRTAVVSDESTRAAMGGGVTEYISLGASDYVHAPFQSVGPASRLVYVDSITTVTSGVNTFSGKIGRFDLKSAPDELITMSFTDGTLAHSKQALIDANNVTVPMWGNGYRAGRAAFSTNIGTANGASGTGVHTAAGVYLFHTAGSPQWHGTVAGYLF